MSAILEHAVARLSQKIAKFDGVIKFSIIDEGEILLDQNRKNEVGIPFVAFSPYLRALTPWQA